MSQLHIGTSGWHYRHWLGRFYREKLPASKMLEYCAQHFNTVELNDTFYRLPVETGLEKWRSTSPPKFCFAAKGSRSQAHDSGRYTSNFDNDQAAYAADDALSLKKMRA